ncbi:MAG: asparaginase, partial [Ilumatobacteraceae bacterium]
PSRRGRQPPHRDPGAAGLAAAPCPPATVNVPAHVPIAVTRRSGFDECVHYGSVVGLAADGSVELAVGDPALCCYPRSSMKPLQAEGMSAAGLELVPELLALVCASHDGTPMHVEGVRRILADAGLDESALGNTPDLPIEPMAAADVLRAGGERRAIQMNCSGKHAGMLATCVVNGWSTGDYLDQTHPVQRAITSTIEELAGDVAHVGVDGCGAPAHVLSLRGLATAFATIAARRGSVWRAMTSHPAMVGGADRDVSKLMSHLPGLMAKDGAEGVFAAALPDGRAVAVKVADGGYRAAPPVLVDALTRLGVDTSVVTEHVVQVIRGHGQPVGEVRSIAFGAG